MAVVVSAFVFRPYCRHAVLNLGADRFFEKSIEWKEVIAFLRRKAWLRPGQRIAGLV
jgi:hypothetical protein